MKASALHEVRLTNNELRALAFASDCGIYRANWPSEWYRAAAISAREKLLDAERTEVPPRPAAGASDT